MTAMAPCIEAQGRLHGAVVASRLGLRQALVAKHMHLAKNAAEEALAQGCCDATECQTW